MSPIAPRALLSLLRICTNAGAGRHVAAGPEAVKQRWPERVGIIRFLSNGGWAASGRRVGGEWAASGRLLFTNGHDMVAGRQTW